MVKITKHVLEYCQSKKYFFCLYAEYEDDYSCYIYGNDEDICITEMSDLDGHGLAIFYTGVNDEDRVDGEWVGRENFIYE